MRVLDERTQVREVARKWAAQYPPGRTLLHGDPQEILAKLRGLDPETATADDVAVIVGNRSWVDEQTCNQCGCKSWGIVEVGEPPDWESHTAQLCGACLRAALQLLADTTAPAPGEEGNTE